MTNGEKFIHDNLTSIPYFVDKKVVINMEFDADWWNAEYKEPTTKNETLVSLDVYKEVARERDIAIQQLHELGYEFGQKIEPVIHDNGIKDELNRDKDELEPTTENCESCKYYGSHHEVCNYCYKCSLWTEKEPTIKNDLAHNLCDSCTNYGCEFQSGIVRPKCAFYMPPHLEPDNCGNYVVQDSTTKNDVADDCISSKIAKEMHLEVANMKKIVQALSSVTSQLSSELDKNSKKLEKDFGESDCISRVDAIRVSSGYCHPSNVAKELAKLPPVTPIRPKGHWIDTDATHSKCDRCGAIFEIASANGEANYCPNCGADMREVEE